MSVDKKIVVGLGNPGKEYLRTRHNLGFWAIDLLSEKLDVAFTKTQHKAHVTQVTYGPWKLLLAKPLTYMNCSGESVRALAEYHQCEPNDFLVLCDDVNLSVGKLRIRKEGSSGGQHGLDSIIESFGTNHFPRLRIGIKPLEEPLPQDLAKFVLSHFSKGEEAIVAETVKRAVDAIFVVLDQGFDAAMNQFNG